MKIVQLLDDSGKSYPHWEPRPNVWYPCAAYTEIEARDDAARLWAKPGTPASWDFVAEGI